MLLRDGDIPVSCLRSPLLLPPLLYREGREHRNLNYCSLRSRAVRIKADFRGVLKERERGRGRKRIGAIINS